MNFGVIGILWGMVFGFYLTAFVNIMIASPFTNYSLINQIRDIIPTLLNSIIAAFISYYSVCYIELDCVLSMIVQIALYIALYIIIAKHFNNIELDEYIKIGKSYIKFR